MISRALIWICFLSPWIHEKALSQELVISREGITDAEFDLQGNIYLSTQQGSIIKFDSSYHELVSFATDQVIPITSIDVSNRFRIFGFFRNNQSYVILDQNLRLLNESPFDPRIIGNGVGACYASDQTIWVFDDLDFSLKKFNPSLNQVAINIQLPLLLGADSYLIAQLEEHQNRIYVNNSENGIYVLDSFGKFLKKLKISTKHVFKIFREKLYYIDQSTVKAIHIYTNEVEIFPGIKSPENLITLLINDYHMLLIYPDSVYRLK
jgi:hypothetical protein